MGKIITLADQEDGYKYELPALPPERDIWYYDVPKKQQYWKTPHVKNFKWLDQNGNIRSVKQMSERDRIEYIEYFRDKWLNGLWIMVNGEPTYLTGAHIDHLVFNKFKNRHFIYLASQRERFYFRDLTDSNPLCDGRLWPKGRRVGITAEQITQNIRVILSDYSNNVAVQSDTHDKAKSTLLSKIIDTYIRRPEWMRESFYSPNGKIPRSSLELIDITVRNDDNYPLGGSARAFPSTPKACDGEEFMLVTMDELSKWGDVSPYETYEINRKTIVNPGKRGKMDCLSTTGDSKEAIKATKDWHKLIADSNPKVINQNGYTNSGLWRFMVSYIHSLELLEKKPEIKDIYGNINKEMAEEYIWNEINRHPKDSKEYIYSLYKMPMKLQHTLLTATTQGYFSKLRITNRLDYLRSLPNDKKPYVRGKLVDGPNGKIYFEADEYGKWLMAVMPYFSTEKNIDTRNRFTINNNGVFFPPVNPEFEIGYDPFRYRKEDTKSSSLSRAAIMVHKKHDYFNSGIIDKRAALYLDRPDDPTDAHKECIKACKFFGAYVMHERNIEKVKEVFEENNMLPFMRKSKKDGLYGMYSDSTGKVAKNGVNMLVTRYAPPKEEGQVDQLAEYPFEDGLMDMDDFDISNTTAFDVTMCEIMLEYGLEQNVFTNQTDKTTNTMMNILMELTPHRKHIV